jgi:hypothetical protein
MILIAKILDLPSLNYLNGNNIASNLFNNIFSTACAKSPLVDEEEDASTDSAIASSEHSGGDQECPLEQVSTKKLNNYQLMFLVRKSQIRPRISHNPAIILGRKQRPAKRRRAAT